jgi:cobalt-zinc-cadmium efflux system protein
VLASGADYVGDAFGTGLSLAALRLSASARAHPRVRSQAALVNSSLLLLVTLAVAAEAIRRLSTGAPSVNGFPVVIVSVVAALAMIACALILGDIEGDLSMQSVMLDTVADAAAAIGVALSGAIILLTHGVYWLDSAIALAIAVVVGYHALMLMRRVLKSLSRTRVDRPSAPRSRGL